MAVGSRAQAETQYTPSVSLSQRYDSNVFFTAKQFVPQGNQSWDLVTTLGTKVDILNKSRLGDTEVRARSRWQRIRIQYRFVVCLHQCARKLRSERLGARVAARPEITNIRCVSVHSAATSLYLSVLSVVTASTIGRIHPGIQGARADAYSNSLSTDGDYSFSRSMGFRANYTYSILHIGRLYVTEPATSTTAFRFFDTTMNNVAFGPTYTFDGGDTLFVKFNYLTSDQSNTAGHKPPDYILLRNRSSQSMLRQSCGAGRRRSVEGLR